MRGPHQAAYTGKTLPWPSHLFSFGPECLGQESKRLPNTKCCILKGTYRRKGPSIGGVKSKASDTSQDCKLAVDVFD